MASEDYDMAEEACIYWITSWRETHRDDRLPSMTFAGHLGSESVRLAAEGPTRTELLKRFSSAGFKGLCVCGMDPASAPRNGTPS